MKLPSVSIQFVLGKLNPKKKPNITPSRARLTQIYSKASNRPKDEAGVFLLQGDNGAIHLGTNYNHLAPPFEALGGAFLTLAVEGGYTSRGGRGVGRCSATQKNSCLLRRSGTQYRWKCHWVDGVKRCTGQRGAYTRTLQHALRKRKGHPQGHGDPRSATPQPHLGRAARESLAGPPIPRS